MANTILYDSEYITVEYVADKRLIHHTIHKPVQGQVFHDALNAGSEALATYGACKWLSDDRKNDILTEDDAVWGIVDWGPRTAQAGWKYWANVVPVDIAACHQWIL